MFTKVKQRYEMGTPANGSLARTLTTRLRAVVGETYWKEATGIFLKQIAITEGNANVMRLLCDDDEALDTLAITVEFKIPANGPFNSFAIPIYEHELSKMSNQDCFGWLGYFIGKSKTVRVLNIDAHNYSVTTSMVQPIYRLFEGITFNKSIEKLDVDIYHDSPFSFKALAPFFRSNVNLTDFKSRGKFDDEDARQVAFGLTHRGSKNSLKKVAIELAVLEREGFQTLTALLNASPLLEQLHLNDTTEEVFRAPGANIRRFVPRWFVRDLVPCLSNNFRGLTELNLSSNYLGDGAMRALALALASCSKLTTLDVSNTKFTDIGMKEVTYSLAKHCQRLTTLNMIQPGTTAVGIRSLRKIFQTSNCCLSRLSVISFSPSGSQPNLIEDILWALEGCKSLKCLDFGEHEPVSGFNNEYLCVSEFLCDKSSVSNTYNSNHSLEAVIYHPITDDELPYVDFFDDVPEYSLVGDVRFEITKFLELNKRNNKRDVAIAKILMSHSVFDLLPLYKWNLKFLPLLLSWFERADWLIRDGWAFEVTSKSVQVRRLTTIYEFIVEMSMMVAKQQRNFLSSKKRKFG